MWCGIVINAMYSMVCCHAVCYDVVLYGRVWSVIWYIALWSIKLVR